MLNSPRNEKPYTQPTSLRSIEALLFGNSIRIMQDGQKIDLPSSIQKSPDTVSLGSCQLKEHVHKRFEPLGLENSKSVETMLLECDVSTVYANEGSSRYITSLGLFNITLLRISLVSRNQIGNIFLLPEAVYFPFGFFLASFMSSARTSFT